MSCWTNKQIFFPINYLWKGKNVDMKRKKKGYQIGGWFGFVVLEKIGDRYNRGIKARSIELNGGNEAKLMSGSKEEGAIGSVMLERKRLNQLGYGERHWDLFVNEWEKVSYSYWVWEEQKKMGRGRRKQEAEGGNEWNVEISVLGYKSSTHSSNDDHRDDRGRPPIHNKLFQQMLFFLLLCYNIQIIVQPI